MNARDDAIRQSYDAVAEEYVRHIAGELEFKPFDRALLDAFAEMSRGGGTIADIGCGPGHVGRYIADRGVPVAGVDISEGMVEIARRLNPDMTFLQGSMLDLPVPDSSWCGILAFYSIIHVDMDRLPIAFGEFHRTLTPGGLLFVAFHMGGKHLHTEEWWGHDVDLDGYHHDREPVEDLLRKAGFTIIAHLEREPDEGVEYPSRRAYIFARKPATS